MPRCCPTICGPKVGSTLRCRLSFWVGTVPCRRCGCHRPENSKFRQLLSQLSCHFEAAALIDTSKSFINRDHRLNFILGLPPKSLVKAGQLSVPSCLVIILLLYYSIFHPSPLYLYLWDYKFIERIWVAVAAMVLFVLSSQILYAQLLHTNRFKEWNCVLYGIFVKFIMVFNYNFICYLFNYDSWLFLISDFLFAFHLIKKKSFQSNEFVKLKLP